MTVLLLAANPAGTSRLNLDEELRQILMKVRASEHRDAITFVPWFAARPDDLMQTLLQHRPDVVHFSGHGSAAGELIFAGDGGAGQPVPAEALRRIFRVLRDNVRLVLLNACWSAPQAEAIAESVDHTIGMTRAIGDQAAIAFAGSFYRALGFGRSVREAFELGTTAVLLEGIPESTTPRLITRPGAPDPAYLINPEPARPDRPTLILSALAGDGRRGAVRYTSREVAGRIVIEPHHPYLDRVRHGGTLGPENANWGYPFETPALDLKVVNHTGRTVVLHEAVLRVGESRTDRRPIPMFHPAAGLYLPLYDDGWGEMTDFVLRFRLAPAEDAAPVGPPFEARFTRRHQGGDMRPYFAAAGVDIELWEALSRGHHRPEDYAERAARALGPFRGGTAVLTGEMTYRGGDGEERTNPILVYFHVDPRYETPLTGALGSSGEYQAVLRADAHDYEVSVPISHSLTPGEADRFLIRLAAERSSLHDLTLALRYDGDQELTSAPVSLDLFVPSTAADFALSTD